MKTNRSLSIWVVLPTYNGAQHLHQQVASIEQQSRPPDGVVAYDDASTDGTVVILNEFAGRAHFPVRVGEQPMNAGLPKNAEDAAQTILDEADVVVFCDQDDVWLSHKIERIELAFLSSETLLWFGDAELIDEHGARLGRRLWEAVGLSAGDDLNRPSSLPRLMAGVTVFGTTMAARTSLIRASLPVPRTVDVLGRQHYQVDSWLAVIASIKSGVVLDSEPSTEYRRHPNQFTAAGSVDPFRGSAPASRRDGLADLQQDLAVVDVVMDALRRPQTKTFIDGDLPPLLLRRQAYLRDRFRALRHDVGPMRLIKTWARGDYALFARGYKTLGLDVMRYVRGPIKSTRTYPNPGSG